MDEENKKKKKNNTKKVLIQLKGKKKRKKPQIERISNFEGSSNGGTIAKRISKRRNEEEGV